ncbi:TolC family protein [Phocaeicola paurosaccharolyticus]|uniref:TolC family protein n=1 Tax=Phocaeicola paurosaccharolyticus TaxID=732242 RepID=UPI000469A770|nr:TolC family protein [Phocaeicola paurosaccharolyticus]
MNKKIYISLFALFSSLSVFAQQHYSLRKCLEIGLEKNYSIRIVKNDEQASANTANAAYAGLLPTVDLSAGYGADVTSSKSTARASGETKSSYNYLDEDFRAGVQLNWTVFDGFGLWTNYKQLKLMKEQGMLQTRISIEDFMAEMASEYYNFIQQKIRLKNFRYAVKLSKERMRIVEERYNIGNFSKLDYQQAKVDFNADSAKYMKQQETLKSSVIRLNELMANAQVNDKIFIPDTIIDVDVSLNYNQLESNMLMNNTDLLRSDQSSSMAQLDLKKVLSRNYPYVKINAGYNLNRYKYEIAANKRVDNWGLSTGVTVGFNIFDGKRAADRKNARLKIESKKLEREDVELSIRANFNNLWQAYRNNIEVLYLERQNVIAAQENYDIAHERYLLGDLSGFEMREAQKSLLDAEERILAAEYNTKMCEISLMQISGNIMSYLKN